MTSAAGDAPKISVAANQLAAKILNQCATSNEPPENLGPSTSSSRRNENAATLEHSRAPSLSAFAKGVGAVIKGATFGVVGTAAYGAGIAISAAVSVVSTVVFGTIGFVGATLGGIGGTVVGAIVAGLFRLLGGSPETAKKIFEVCVTGGVVVGSIPGAAGLLATVGAKYLSSIPLALAGASVMKFGFNLLESDKEMLDEINEGIQFDKHLLQGLASFFKKDVAQDH